MLVRYSDWKKPTDAAFAFRLKPSSAFTPGAPALGDRADIRSLASEVLEPEDAVRTAEIQRNLGWDTITDAYDAACYLSLCVPVVSEHAELDATQRKESARFYGDAAMELLRDAVSKGFRDVAHMRKDTDLDPLRPRGDFQKFVAELEGKGK